MTAHEIYVAHGLTEVELDFEHPLTPWKTGSAYLSSQQHLPLLGSPNDRVRFAWCSKANSFDRFRRRAQLIALDTLPPSPGPSSATCSKFTPVNEVVAWWEDNSGCWLLTRGNEETSEVKDRFERIKESEDVEWHRACFALVTMVETLMVSDGRAGSADY